MRIVLAKHNGFCEGVKRSVNAVKSYRGGDACVLGELVHNSSVVKELADMGVKTVNTLDEVDTKTVFIKAHGETKSVLIEAKKRGLNVIDLTCPFVKKIHGIVEKYHKLGYAIVIIGDKNHDEIKGINGWCDDKAYIFDGDIDFGAIDKDCVCVVVQTTYSQEKFEKILKNIPKNLCKKVEIFKTICYTTMERQREASEMAKNCEAMLVIGSLQSSNTNKLQAVCEKFCANVFRADSCSSVDYKKLCKFKSVGIVSGASTPNMQSSEVFVSMENVTKVEASENNVNVESVKAEPATSAMAEVMENMAAKQTKFRVGQIITATISLASDDGLALYIGNTKKEIALSKDEMDGVYNKADWTSKVGDEIEVMIIGVDPVKLSQKAIKALQEEEKEIDEIENGKIFNGTVTATNKGGLIGKYGSYVVFVPSSQIRIGFVKELDKYVGKTLRVKAEKVEREKRKQIVASQRVVLQAEKDEREKAKAEREEAFFDAIKEGDVITGEVVRFAAFGAFVSVNGFDCLAHISDLSWTGVKECSDVLELNKKYDFVVLKIDRETKKVSLGYKQLQPKPWDLVPEKYAIGDTVHGKVVRLVSFGAFVELEKGVDGLVHVSQISHDWLESPVGALEVGQEVDAKILNIDVEKQKITLSIKALLPEPEERKTNPNKPQRAPKADGDDADKPRRKPRTPKAEEDGEMRSWQDNQSSGASIAEMIANLDK